MSIQYRRFTRREVLAIGAGAGAAALFPFAPSLAAASPLITRPIPRSGERLPAVGLGTAIVFDIEDDPDQLAGRRAVIQSLLDGGGKLIDTAPSYGNAEAAVGELLAGMHARERVFLATKVRVAGREASLAEMRRSLQRLKTSQVDLIQLHNVKDVSTDLGVIKAWRDEGHARYVGITHFVAGAYDRLAEVIRREQPEFVQINYSLAERSAEERLLPLAAETGTAVLVNLPFGRGKLFSAVRAKPLPEWAKEFDATSWAQLFLKYLLSHEAVTCVMPGTDKAQHMADNLAAGRGRLPDAAMRRKIVEYWSSIA